MRQAIIWNNDELLSIGPLGTNFSDILIDIQQFAFMKMGLKMLTAKWLAFCQRLFGTKPLPVPILTVHWTLCNLNQSTTILFQENLFESFVCKMAAILFRPQYVNSLVLRQNDWLITDDIFNCIFFNENLRIWFRISLKFFPMGPIDYKSVLV